MAESGAIMERPEILLARVAVIAADPGWRARLAARVSAMGHVVADVADADIALTDSDVSSSDLPAVVLGGTVSDAAGVLGADASDAQLDAALRAVAAGLTVRPLVRESRFEALEEPEAAALLTPREIDVLVGLSEGLSNKAVARRLDISQHTVKFHVESIFRKLSVTTRAEAVAKGLRRGWVHL